MKRYFWLKFCYLLFLLTLFLLTKMTPVTYGQGKEEEQRQVQPSEGLLFPHESEPSKEEKKEARTIGTLLLGLVLFLGIVTIVFVVFWSKRIRRMVRYNKASPTKLDEFWYLQAAKEDPTETKPDPSENDTDIDINFDQ